MYTMSHFLYTAWREPSGKLQVSMGQWFTEKDIRRAIAEWLSRPGLLHCEYIRHDEYGRCYQEYTLPDGHYHIVPTSLIEQ